MAENSLSILKPSVNNLTARIFVRAAGLDFEEVDVWGQTTTPEFLAKDPAHLTPLLEEDGLPRGSLWESCAIMQYLCNKHGLDRLYPTDPGERAMTDSAMFYLIGTFYPLVARATYPALGFPQYPGEVATSAASDEIKAQAQQDAEAALAEPLEAFRFFMEGRPFIGGDSPVDRGHPAGGDARVPEGDRLRLPRLDDGLHGGRRGSPRRRVQGAGGRRPRVRGRRQGTGVGPDVRRSHAYGGQGLALKQFGSWVMSAPSQSSTSSFSSSGGSGSSPSNESLPGPPSMVSFPLPPKTSGTTAPAMPTSTITCTRRPIAGPYRPRSCA